MEVNAGKPLRALNEEEFGTWSVSKLRRTLDKVDTSIRGDASEELPVLEKQELVERLLKVVRAGHLIEDEEDSRDPLVRFSRRLTHIWPQLEERWPHLARLRALCSLRAAGLILHAQLEQMNSSVSEQVAAVHATAADHAEQIRRDEALRWQTILGDVHAQILREQGFVDLDPGRCFPGDGPHSYASCCSIGDFAQDCWQQTTQQRERDTETDDDDETELEASRSLSPGACCGAAARVVVQPETVATVSAKLGAASPLRPSPQELIPAVSAWLQDPSGHADTGEAFSSRVISLLADVASQQDIVHGASSNLERPLKQLSNSLRSLAQGAPGQLPGAGSPEETWLPAPPVVSTAGRRILYTTVALTPQLQPHDSNRADADFEAIPVQDLPNHATKAASDRGQFQHSASASPATRALQDSLLLLEKLEEEHLTELASAEPGRQGQQHMARRKAPMPLHQGSCSYGWQDLTPSEASELGVGSKVRVRQRTFEDVLGGEGIVERITALGAEADNFLDSHMTILWQVAFGDGHTGFHDFNDPNLLVAVPCSMEEAEESLSDAAGAPWPACILPKMGAPSAVCNGLFVNLESFDITSGCYQENCGHSDHFASETPAVCARICASIPACEIWTFSEGSPSTCWLRSGTCELQENAAAVSGLVTCSPPLVTVSGDHVTLFDLLANGAGEGVLPAMLWNEPNLFAALEAYGHATLQELPHMQPTPLQMVAMRIAALAQSRCPESWAGC